MNKASKLITVLFLISLAFNANSQDNQKSFSPKTSFFREKGFCVGASTYSVVLPEGKNYHPLLLMGSFGLQLTKKEKKGKWWIILEPQINPIFIGTQLKEAEFGINAAFRYKYQIAETFYCYVQLGSGPHFITIATERQAHGFIFSDNLAIGISKLLSNNWILNTECRIRHISNANVIKPNRGMNNLFLVVGLSRKIK